MTRRFWPVFVLLTLSPCVQAQQEATVRLRQILVASSEAVSQLEQRLSGGESFEALARELSIDFSASRGGYLGPVSRSELRPEFQAAIAGLRPGEVSSPVRIGERYYLFQPVPEAEANWIDLDEEGHRALQQGRDAEAAGLFQAALEQAEAFGEDYRLGRSLVSLAELYRIGGRSAEAEALYDRALPILEQVLGPQHPDVGQTLNSLGLVLSAQKRYREAESAFERSLRIGEATLGPNDPQVATTLNNLAQIYLAQDRLAEAAPLYERSYEIFLEALGAGHPLTAASAENLHAFGRAALKDILERLAEIVSLADFKDPVFDQRMEELEGVLARTPLDLEWYLTIEDALLDAGLREESEAILRSAVERFPGSRRVRVYLADRLASFGRTSEALELFEQAAGMGGEPDLDPASDRQQRAFIHQKIGEMLAALGRREEAEVAYLEAVEIDANTPGVHMRLGNLYFDEDRLPKALEQYEQASTGEDLALARYSALAETYLALQDWEGAADAAAKVLEMDASESQAHFIRGQALVRLGDRDEGARELEEFSRLDGEARAEQELYRQIREILNSGLAAVLEGRTDRAVEIFRAGIEAYPKNASIYMSLALTYQRSGRHREAAEVFQSMVDLGISDHFLIHRSLAEEYQAMGATESSRRHHELYLEARDAELRAALPE